MKALGYAAALLVLSVSVGAPHASGGEARCDRSRIPHPLHWQQPDRGKRATGDGRSALTRERRFDRRDATAITTNNFSLEDHWIQGPARATLAKGGWSIIVIQQGPSALPDSHVLLRDYARRFAADACRVGARTALYMVWPSKARDLDFDAVSNSYTLAAQDVGGTLLPAGDAWREAWRRDPSLALYADDGFHPSGLGSYLRR